MPKRATGVHSRTRSSIWQWRIKTPKDLQHLYRSKYAHRCSLGTSSLAEANVKATRLYADWLAKFAEQREQAIKTPEPKPIDAITPEVSQLIADTLLHDILAVDDDIRTNAKKHTLGGGMSAVLEGMPDHLSDELSEVNRQRESDTAEALSKSRRAVALPAMQSTAEKLGLAIDPQTPGFAEALLVCLKALRQAATLAVKRDQGEDIATPPRPEAKQPEARYRLRDVFAKWKEAESHAISQDTIQARERALCLYEEFSGNPLITDITRAQGIDFRAWLLKKSGASQTARNRFIYVKALVGFAHRELELIPRHPWDRMNIEATTERKRKPWTPDQIKAFFDLPLFSAYALPKSKRAGADAAYWIPLLGLFTGARSAELCQLQVTDILEEQGVFVIDINEVEDGKRLKTKASRRKVPIHSELIRLGFLDYVRDMKDAGHVGLWPKLHLNPKKPSHGFSLWFNQDAYRESLGDDFPDFHALRHTVRSAMSVANVPEPDQDKITGHASNGSTGTKVYRHVPLIQIQQGVEAIRYPTFNLARTYPRLPQ